jgi:hypothetical protein
MSIQLQPQETLTIVRVLQDPSDVSTNYVQAVVRNSRTDEIIDTVRLTDRTNRRFTKDWRVPADTSGFGFYVDITTSVYTDSEYTVKSTTYGEENETYLVQDRARQKNGNGGGLARRDIRDIVSEELAKIVEELKPKKEKPKDTPPPKDYDDSFAKLLKAISKIEKPQKVNLEPIIEGLTNLEIAVNEIEIPKLEIEPVISAVEEAKNSNIENTQQLKWLIQGFKDDLSTMELKNTLDEFKGDVGKTFESVIQKIVENFSLVTSAVTFVKGKELPAVHKNNLGIEDKSPEDEIDINKLSQ